MTKSFSGKIIKWYSLNKRDLPWRTTNDAYKIWISEIIMQQTRIDQGTSYYLRFLKRFPDVFSLAKSDEQSVLKLWQGLGYYSRARNLYETACNIVDNYNGKFPRDYSELLKFKGIGEYTAAAIASIAFNQPFATIDGNVTRFTARFYGISSPVDTSVTKREIFQIATKKMDQTQAGNYNQALMEFGALICKPKIPLCNSCIFNTECSAFKNQLVSDIPVKQDKIKVRNRFFNYLLIKNNNKTTYILKHRGNDIWKGLYDLPMVETKEIISKEKLEKLLNQKEYFGNQEIRIQTVSKPHIHILSHQRLHAIFYQLEGNGLIQISGFKTKFEEVRIEDLKNYPIPRLLEKFLIDIKIFNSE